MPGVHQELRRQFARQAEDFERPQWSFGDEGLLRWVADATPIGGEDRVLDAAGGPERSDASSRATRARA